MDKQIASKIPNVNTPELVDLAILPVREILALKLHWLDWSFGKAITIVGESPTYKLEKTPTVFAGKNEYFNVLPNDKLGNFCFFKIHDPQIVDYQRTRAGKIELQISVIFWVDTETIAGADNRNTEAIKKQILEAFGHPLRSGRLTIEKIYEEPENIYPGYSLDVRENQFSTHPYYSVRFEGVLTNLQLC